MKEFARKNIVVNILGNDYTVRELSLAQKISLLSDIGSFIRDLAKNAFFKKNDKGGIFFDYIDEVSLAELNIDKIILGFIGLTPELLKLSIPDFSDWDNLPESETRDILRTVINVNDFKGFITNFFFQAKEIIR